MANINQPNEAYYDIDWDKVKTIKDIKKLLQIIASKVVINHNDEEDVKVYDSIVDLLKESS